MKLDRKYDCSSRCYVVLQQAISMTSSNCKQLEVEDELRIGWDVGGRSFLAIAMMRRDCDTTLTACSHTSNTDIPACNHFAGAELEGEWFALFVCFFDLLAPGPLISAELGLGMLSAGTAPLHFCLPSKTLPFSSLPM